MTTPTIPRLQAAIRAAQAGYERCTALAARAKRRGVRSDIIEMLYLVPARAALAAVRHHTYELDQLQRLKRIAVTA